MRACWLKWVGRDWSISADYIWLNYSGANSEDVLGRKMGLNLSFTLPKTATTSLTYMLNISKKKLFLKYPQVK